MPLRQQAFKALGSDVLGYTSQEGKTSRRLRGPYRPILHGGNGSMKPVKKWPKIAISALHDRWILDTGSGVYVYNKRSWFVNLTPAKESLVTRDGNTAVIGRGTVKLTGADPISGKEKTITLSNACYAPSFYVNLVSYARLREKGGE
ncbi:hypothetical protein N7522_005949 [Penicillium canescens]|nr:hypothetical protein N7522_005949 [Penicillium canescens]